MCELLVRVVDKVSADPYLDAALTKRGDVIAVQPDGWVWGLEEQRSPEWRILRVPGVSVAAAASLLTPEPETDPQNPSRMLQRRMFRLDLDAPELTGLLASRKGKPAHRADLSIDDLLALRIRKPAIQDPNTLG